MLPLSVVIPSYCRPDLLRCCISSVVRHAPEGTEIIVVDDASPGGQVSATAAGFSGVQIIRLSRRSGFSIAANAGIRAAHHAIVELLNDDTEVCASWALAALTHFSDASVGAVAPLVLHHPAHAKQTLLIDSAGDGYYLGGIACKHGHGQRLYSYPLHSGRVFGASASSAFYRREALEKVGGFPESFGAYFEDVDLSFRLNRAGYKVMFAPESRVCHRVSASYGKSARRVLQLQSLNEERVFWRNVPNSALHQALPRHLAVLAGKAIRRWNEGTLIPFVLGRMQVIGDLPSIIRHRRRLKRLDIDDDIREWQIDLKWKR